MRRNITTKIKKKTVRFSLTAFKHFQSQGYARFGYHILLKHLPIRNPRIHF